MYKWQCSRNAFLCKLSLNTLWHSVCLCHALPKGLSIVLQHDLICPYMNNLIFWCVNMKTLWSHLIEYWASFQHMYHFFTSRTMLPLLTWNLSDNLCCEAWPQLHFIDSFVMSMWYLPRERCLLLAPHAAMFSFHNSKSLLPPLFVFKCIDPLREPASWSK